MFHFLRQRITRDRLRHLFNALTREIGELTAMLGHPPSVLDYGCGKMEIANYLLEYRLAASMQCIDLYPKPSHADPSIWGKYQQLLSPALPFTAQQFDLAIIIDVLHHAGLEAAPGILRQLAQCASFVLVKDHFEYGFFSRQLLRMADYYGNWATGVHTHDRYFSPRTWQETLQKAGLEQVKFRQAVKIHSGLSGLILPFRYHFIALLHLPPTP